MLKTKSNKPEKAKKHIHMTHKSHENKYQGKQKPRYQQDKLMNLKTKSNN